MKVSVNSLSVNNSLDKLYAKLYIEVETRQLTYNKRTTEWRLSDVGIEYRNRTDQISEALCLISRAGELLMGNE